MSTQPYYHVDVFTDQPFSGNGLTVFTEAEDLSKGAMLQLTQEMRQFESIFLERIRPNTIRAHIFTCQEELDFAGHPVLGAAATLHDLYQPETTKVKWTFILNAKEVSVLTEKKKLFYTATMNQGKAVFGRELDVAETALLFDYMGLSQDDLYEGCYPVIVSTGLPYLLIPLKRNGALAKLSVKAIEDRIRSYGAMFIGILEIPTLRIRSGDNDGLVEDIATGSLAGPAGAYLVKKGFQKPGSIIQLHQGENLGRPSQLFVEVDLVNGELADTYVSGNVFKVAQGVLVAEPIDQFVLSGESPY